jgi:hypothetical protein
MSLGSWPHRRFYDDQHVVGKGTLQAFHLITRADQPEVDPLGRRQDRRPSRTFFTPFHGVQKPARNISGRSVLRANHALEVLPLDLGGRAFALLTKSG